MIEGVTPTGINGYDLKMLYFIQAILVWRFILLLIYWLRAEKDPIEPARSLPAAARWRVLPSSPIRPQPAAVPSIPSPLRPELWSRRTRSADYRGKAEVTDSARPGIGRKVVRTRAENQSLLQRLGDRRHQGFVILRKSRHFLPVKYSFLIAHPTLTWRRWTATLESPAIHKEMS